MVQDNLARTLPEEYPEVEYEEAFIIDSPGKAEWAVQKLKADRENRDLYVAAAQERIDYYQSLIRAEDVKLEARSEYLRARLREWFDLQPKRELKASYAVNLPSGKLSLAKPRRDFVRNDETLEPFLRTNASEYIKQKIVETIDWASLKPHMTIVDTPDGAIAVLDTGEVVEGVTVIDKAQEFTIK